MTSDSSNQSNSRWIVHGRRTIYQSDWVRLGMADIEQPNGTRFEHHEVWMPPAAMTVLLDDEKTHVLLLWRHRFVADLWNWELPGGVVDEGEDPQYTAEREIEEETGYRPRELVHLVTFEPMIGMLECPHHVFLGQGAMRVSAPVEENEMSYMKWFELRKIPSIIAAGEVKNSGTLVALLHLLGISGPTARSEIDR